MAQAPSFRPSWAELVRYGIDGLQFRIADPRQLSVLLAQAPPVPRIEDQARTLREYYRELLTSAR